MAVDRELSAGADDAVAHDAALIGERLHARSAEVAGEMTRVIAAEVEFLDDPEMFAMLSASVEGNVETIAQLLRNSIPVSHAQPPTAAIEYAYRLAQRGMPGDALRRAYHLGSESLRTDIFAEIQALDRPPDVKLYVQHYLDGFLHSYVDVISLEVLAAHASEVRRHTERSASASAAAIRGLLAGEDVRQHEFESLTGFRLGRTHRAAVVWVDSANPGVDHSPALTRLVTRVARAFEKAAAPLVTAVDRGTVWAWFPADSSRPDPARLEAAVAEVPGARLAFGSSGEGPDGFCRSHAQARAAESVLLASATGMGTAFYGDPGVAIASVLVRDLEATRGWVAEQLGGLAAPTAQAERLRETLLAFLDNSGSFARTGEEMSLHRNTVKYRVDRAVELRGRPVERAGSELAMALQVCRILGGGALGRPGSLGRPGVSPSRGGRAP